MIELSWDVYARQLLGVLSSAAAVFLFLALLAFEWHRMQALRDCREAARQIKERNEELRRERDAKRDERRRLAGLPPRGMAGALKKLIKG